MNNPNRVEEVDNRTPQEIIAEIEELDVQAAEALRAIKELAVMWKIVKLEELEFKMEDLKIRIGSKVDWVDNTKEFIFGDIHGRSE